LLLFENIMNPHHNKIYISGQRPPDNVQSGKHSRTLNNHCNHGDQSLYNPISTYSCNNYNHEFPPLTSSLQPGNKGNSNQSVKTDINNNNKHGTNYSTTNKCEHKTLHCECGFIDRSYRKYEEYVYTFEEFIFIYDRLLEELYILEDVSEQLHPKIKYKFQQSLQQLIDNIDSLNTAATDDLLVEAMLDLLNYLWENSHQINRRVVTTTTIELMDAATIQLSTKRCNMDEDNIESNINNYNNYETKLNTESGNRNPFSNDYEFSNRFYTESHDTLNLSELESDMIKAASIDNSDSEFNSDAPKSTLDVSPSITLNSPTQKPVVGTSFNMAVMNGHENTNVANLGGHQRNVEDTKVAMLGHQRNNENTDVNAIKNDCLNNQPIANNVKVRKEIISSDVVAIRNSDTLNIQTSKRFHIFDELNDMEIKYIRSVVLTLAATGESHTNEYYIPGGNNLLEIYGALPPDDQFIENNHSKAVATIYGCVNYMKLTGFYEYVCNVIHIVINSSYRAEYKFYNQEPVIHPGSITSSLITTLYEFCNGIEEDTMNNIEDSDFTATDGLAIVIELLRLCNANNLLPSSTLSVDDTYKSWLKPETPLLSTSKTYLNTNNHIVTPNIMANNIVIETNQVNDCKIIVNDDNVIITKPHPEDSILVYNNSCNNSDNSESNKETLFEQCIFYIRSMIISGKFSPLRVNNLILHDQMLVEAADMMLCNTNLIPIHIKQYELIYQGYHLYNEIMKQVKLTILYLLVIINQLLVALSGNYYFKFSLSVVTTDLFKPP
jgi:hypothetical protein